MFKRGIGIVAIFIMILCLGGCRMSANYTNNTETKDQNVVLTDQQKEILTKEELPLDYSQLTGKQKIYLSMADDMLTYVNEKYAPYGVNFTYIAYHHPELLDKEARILIVPDGYDSEIDTVEVSKKDGNYEDDYLDFAVRIEFEKLLNKHFAEFLPEEQFRVYVSSLDVGDVKTEELTKLNEDFLMQHTISRIGAYILISDEICKTDDELMKFTTEFFTWMKENKFYGGPWVEVCRNERFTSSEHKDFSEVREGRIAFALGTVRKGQEFDIEIRGSVEQGGK